MYLDRVTITGADDSVDPRSLLDLSREFPYVEWGILVSASHIHNPYPRFPGIPWLMKLQDLAAQNGDLKLSLHFCGRWVRGLLLGEQPAGMPDWFTGPQFQRMQLNFHAETLQYNAERFGEALLPFKDKQIIFQIDGNLGERFWAAIVGADIGLDCVPLFDCSHGAGVLPGKWPQPFASQALYQGYAGGLGPDNLAVQLALIGSAAGETRIWVDMESGVRTDERFDLAKVRRCLEICRPFVREAA